MGERDATKILRIVESIFRNIDEEVLIKLIRNAVTKYGNCVISGEMRSGHDLSDSDGEIFISVSILTSGELPSI